MVVYAPYSDAQHPRQQSHSPFSVGTDSASLVLRAGKPEDAAICGEICYSAFAAISDQHHFPHDFPSAEAATGFLAGLLLHSKFYAVVAELNGNIAGSNFLDERCDIAGIGPVTVDPGVQNSAVGRQLMMQVLQRAAEQHYPGIRLVQAAYHNRSLALYTKLGFVTREPLSTMQGTPPAINIPGYTVRPAMHEDLASCNELCKHVHGHDRSGELQDAIGSGAAMVVEFGGRIFGYTTSVAFFGHTVAEHNEALKALIAHSMSYGGPGFLVPTRNTEVFNWCLQNGLRVVQPMTLMTVGLYNDPRGAYLPSILY